VNDYDVTATVKDSLSNLHMSRSADEIMAVGDAQRRRHRRSSLAVTTVAAIAAFFAVAGATLALSAVHPSRAPTTNGGNDTHTTVEIRQVGFTLRINSDGSVDFTATDVVDPAAATTALNNAGIAGRVVVHRDACAPVNWNDVAVIPPFPKPTVTPQPPHKPGIMGDETVTLRSSDYPPGGGLLVVIVVRQHPEGTWAHVSWLGYSDVNKIPTCVQLHDPGTGADPYPGG
jgi:hypothetical protein